MSAKIIKFEPAGTPAVKQDAPAAVLNMHIPEDVCFCPACQHEMMEADARDKKFGGFKHDLIVFDEFSELSPFAWESDEAWKEVAEKARLALIQYQLKGMQI